MQYVNCLYTAQGDYVCQKNEKMDAFYNKPIAEGFWADGDAVQNEGQKVDANVAVCYPFNAAQSNICKNSLTTGFLNVCGTGLDSKWAKPVKTCSYKTDGKVAECDNGTKAYIDSVYKFIADGGQGKDVTFDCTKPKPEPAPVTSRRVAKSTPVAAPVTAPKS